MSGKSKAKPLSIGAVVAIVVGAVVALQQTATERSSSKEPERRAVRAESGGAAVGAGSQASSRRDPDAPDPDTTKAEPRADSMVRIGSWNIEWLGKPGDRSGLGQGTAQTADDLTDYIAASQVSVLALEEIVGRSGPAGPRSEEIDAVVSRLKSRTGQTWRYELFPGRREDAQLTGLMWNTSVATPVGEDGKAQIGDPRPMRLPVETGMSSQGSGLWNRPPHAMKFSFGNAMTDLVLVVVHMKADYQGDFAAQRAAEVQSLVAVLPGVSTRFRDHDVVVLGDTNMTRPNEPAARALVEAGLDDLNSKAEPTHWRGGATDRIFVPRSQPEFADRRFEVLSDRYLEAKRWEPRDFKRRLSDHYMVVVTVKLMRDDD